MYSVSVSQNITHVAKEIDACAPEIQLTCKCSKVKQLGSHIVLLRECGKASGANNTSFSAVWTYCVLKAYLI